MGRVAGIGPALLGMVPAPVGWLVLALVARNENARRHAMHAAVAVALIGAIASLIRAIPAVAGGSIGRPAVIAQLAMAVLLLVYVALGVQSFIAARKARIGR